MLKYKYIFSNEILACRSNFVKQHLETVMVWNYQNDDSNLKKITIVSFIIIVGTLCFRMPKHTEGSVANPGFQTELSISPAFFIFSLSFPTYRFPLTHLTRLRNLAWRSELINGKGESADEKSFYTHAKTETRTLADSATVGYLITKTDTNM